MPRAPKLTGAAKRAAAKISGKEIFPGDSTHKRSPEREQKFLDALAAGWSVTRACAEAGITRQTAQNWRREAEAAIRDLDHDDPKNQTTFEANFAVRWEIAIEAGTETIEDEATRRATKGVERPIYQGGELVGYVTEHSDTLMTLILKGRHPQRYGVERKELTGANGAALIPGGIEIEFVAPSKKVKK